MAIIANDPNQQQDPNKQPDQNSASQPVSVSGSAAPSGGGAPSGGSSSSQSSSNNQTPASQYQAQNSQATPAGTSSGRFQNIQNYLKANAGYNQGQGLAGQIGSTLTGQEQQQEQQIGQEGQRVQSEAGKASAQYSPEATQAYLKQSLADPTKVNMDQWKQYYGGTYNAPSYDASGQLRQQQQQFQNTVGQAGSEQGRMAMLQQLYGTPGYSSGQQNLDQLLLQSQPGQLQQLQQQAGSLSSNLSNLYNQRQASSDQANQAAQAAAQQASLATKAALGDEKTGYIAEQEKGLQQRALDTQSQREGQVKDALSQLQQGKVDPSILAQLGLAPDSSIYNIDPSKYLNQDVGKVGIGQVATDADRAKFSALAQMAGQTPGSALDQYAASSGSPLGNALQFDKAGFQKAVENAASTYNKALQDSNATSSNLGDSSGDAFAKGQAVQQDKIKKQAFLQSLGSYGIDPVTGKPKAIQSLAHAMSPANHNSGISQ